ISPATFKKYLVPNYQKITRMLKQYGIDVVVVDCDGSIDQLIPLWLEAGVNCMFPVEVGVWGADVIAYRKQYGQQLLMIGGFDKKILLGDHEGIEKEIHRLLPLI